MKVKNGGDYFLERFADIYDEITKTLPPNLDFVYLTFIETKKKRNPLFLSPSVSCNHQSIVCIYELVFILIFVRTHVWEIIWYLFLCVWWISLGIMVSVSICVVANGMMFLWLSNISLCIHLLTPQFRYPFHPSVGTWLLLYLGW